MTYDGRGQLEAKGDVSTLLILLSIEVVNICALLHLAFDCHNL